MTIEDLVEVVNLLRVELKQIERGQKRLHKLIAFIVSNQNRILDVYRQAPLLRGKSTGKELLN